MEVVLLDHGHVGAHGHDVGIHGLAIEEGDAFGIDRGLAGADAAGDDAAVAQRVVIGFGGAAEGVGQELLGQLIVLAVGGDVEGGAYRTLREGQEVRLKVEEMMVFPDDGALEDILRIRT